MDDASTTRNVHATNTQTHTTNVRRSWLLFQDDILFMVEQCKQWFHWQYKLSDKWDWFKWIGPMLEYIWSGNCLILERDGLWLASASVSACACNVRTVAQHIPLWVNLFVLYIIRCSPALAACGFFVQYTTVCIKSNSLIIFHSSRFPATFPVPVAYAFFFCSPI